MSRSAKFNLTALLGLVLTFLLLSIAHAGTAAPPDPSSAPGDFATWLASAAHQGMYAAVTLALLWLAEMGLLWYAKRPNSKLASWVPYLAAAFAVTGTTLASVANSAGADGFKALPMAALTAFLAYRSMPSQKAGTAQRASAQSGKVDGEVVFSLVAITAVLVGIMIAISGCGPLSQVPKQAEACAIDAAKAEYPAAVSDIESLVTSHSPNLTAYLDGLLADAESLGLAGGAATVKCIVDAVIADLTSKAGASPVEMDGVRRLQAWKAAH